MAESMMEMIREYFQNSENLLMIYKLSIIISGMLVFYLLVLDGINVPFDIIAIIVWLVLVIAFPIPKSLQLDKFPFSNS